MLEWQEACDALLFTDTSPSTHDASASSSSQPPSLVPAAKRQAGNIPAPFIALTGNKYTTLHAGPYEIHIEKYQDTLASSNSTRPSLSSVTLGKAISKFFPSLWTIARHATELGLATVSVQFPDANTANKAVVSINSVDDRLFTHSVWVAYIANFKIQRTMITRDIPADEITEDIRNHIGPHPVGRGLGHGRLTLNAFENSLMMRILPKVDL